MSPIFLTFAGDESGDVGFSFTRGATRFFTIARIATENPDTLRNVVPELQKTLNLDESYEFKFHRISSKKMKDFVFRRIVKEPFKIWAIIVDKLLLPDSFRFISATDFYLYFVTELINAIPPEDQENSLLILDQFGSKENISARTRKVMQSRNIPKRFKRIIAKDSETEPLIQIADLVAGAITHRDSMKGNDYFELIERKIVEIIEYHS